jgi:hypothetical protein
MSLVYSEEHATGPLKMQQPDLRERIDDGTRVPPVTDISASTAERRDPVYENKLVPLISEHARGSMITTFAHPIRTTYRGS